MLRLWFLEFEKDGRVFRRYFADRDEARAGLKAFKADAKQEASQVTA
jgi:hypothetical protein